MIVTLVKKYYVFCSQIFKYSIHFQIVTRNNIVWKLGRGYCYCKTFSQVSDSTECTKCFLTKRAVHYLYHLKLNDIVRQRKTTNTEKHFHPWLILFNLKLSQQTFVGLKDVLKTSSRHILKTSSTRLQHNNFWSSKTSCKDVLKMSWRHLARRLEDVLEDENLLRWRCLQDVLKMSSRRLEYMPSRYLKGVLETKKWWYLYLKNPSGYVSNKSIFHKSIPDKSKANPKSSIRTQWFQYSSYFKIQAAFLFWELKSLMTVWCCEISWIQIRHYRTGEAIKTKF